MENEGTEVEERETESPAGVRTGEKERDRKRKRERETSCGVRCVRPTYIYGVSRVYCLSMAEDPRLKTETCAYRRRVYRSLKVKVTLS